MNPCEKQKHEAFLRQAIKVRHKTYVKDYSDLLCNSFQDFFFRDPLGFSYKSHYKF
jgi:hypothetical protein